jgi:hypothetical protein
MDKDTKPLVWMIVFGVVRTVIAWVGGWMQNHGIIDPETHQRLLSEGVSQLVSWLFLAIPLVWTILQKTQVWGWVRTALHLPAGTSPGTIPTVSPGPDHPL